MSLFRIKTKAAKNSVLTRHATSLELKVNIKAINNYISRTPLEIFSMKDFPGSWTSLYGAMLNIYKDS